MAIKMKVNINSLDHKVKRDHYEHYKKHQICTDLKLKAVNLIEDKKKLLSLSSDDDSTIIAFGLQITTTHQEVDTIATNGFTWIKVSIKFLYECQN